MKTNLSCVILLLGSFLSSAQTITPEVSASAGGYSSSSNNSVAWTIGEPFSETYSSSNNILTQGFHQPLAAAVIAIEEQPDGNSIIAFPNPLVDQLSIYFGKNEGDFLVSIYDFSGKVVFSETITTKNLPGRSHRISFSKYSSGPYHLQLINQHNQLKTTYTIIKQ